MTIIRGYTIFYHAMKENPQQQGQTRAGVMIILCPELARSWTRAGKLEPITSPHQLQISRPNDRANSLIPKQVKPFDWHLPLEGKMIHQTLSVLNLLSARYRRTKRVL